MLAGSLLSSVAQVINNELADAVYGLLETNPHLLPDPATLAEMAARRGRPAIDPRGRHADALAGHRP